MKHVLPRFLRPQAPSCALRGSEKESNINLHEVTTLLACSVTLMVIRTVDINRSDWSREIKGESYCQLYWFVATCKQILTAVKVIKLKAWTRSNCLAYKLQRERRRNRAQGRSKALGKYRCRRSRWGRRMWYLILAFPPPLQNKSSHCHNTTT